MTMQDLILAHATRQAMHAAIADRCFRPDIECFYFGHVERSGHQLLCTCHRRISDAYETERIASAALGGLDASLCWNSPRAARDRYDARDESEGRAFRTCRGGWTAVAFWDRSGDRRGASNTVFLVRGEMTFSQVIRVAKHAWPKVWTRFTFPVVEVDARGQEVRHG